MVAKSVMIWLGMTLFWFGSHFPNLRQHVDCSILNKYLQLSFKWAQDTALSIGALKKKNIFLVSCYISSCCYLLLGWHCYMDAYQGSRCIRGHDSRGYSYPRYKVGLKWRLHQQAIGTHKLQIQAVKPCNLLIGENSHNRTAQLSPILRIHLLSSRCILRLSFRLVYLHPLARDI